MGRGGIMSKILTTQLSGLLQRITQNEEDAIEETARLLAQAAIGEGNVYFACRNADSGIKCTVSSRTI